MGAELPSLYGPRSHFGIRAVHKILQAAGCQLERNAIVLVFRDERPKELSWTATGLDHMRVAGYLGSLSLRNTKDALGVFGSIDNARIFRATISYGSPCC